MTEKQEVNQELDQHDVFMHYFMKDRNRIYRFVFYLLPNEADAEDAFQQASIVLWKSFSDFDQDREFFKWACGVAYHAVQNYRRKTKRRCVNLDDDVLELIASEQMKSSPRSRYRLELLQECIALLKKSDRKLLQDVYQEGASAQAAAERMGRAVQTVYNRLNIIRKGLLECVNRKSSSA